MKKIVLLGLLVCSGAFQSHLQAGVTLPISLDTACKIWIPTTAIAGLALTWTSGYFLGNQAQAKKISCRFLQGPTNQPDKLHARVLSTLSGIMALVSFGISAACAYKLLKK